MNATNTIGKIIELPKIVDLRGNLTVAESSTNIPFDIKRAYWVYDVPGGECRGGHAHKQLTQLVIALSGSFHVTGRCGKKGITAGFRNKGSLPRSFFKIRAAGCPGTDRPLRQHKTGREKHCCEPLKPIPKSLHDRLLLCR